MSIIPNDLFGLKVEVVRSKRKTAALHIIEDKIQVRVPNRLRDGKVVEILKTKEKWIRGKVVQLQNRLKVKERDFVSGEYFSFFGKNYRLKVLEGGRIGTKLDGGYLLTNVRASECGDLRKARIKSYIEKWYIQEACKILEKKVIRYSEIIRVYPIEIKVRNYKTRWGSCDEKGRLTFNWHLIKAPHFIVDYVVIHELCHMVYSNHSQDFWREVEKYDPFYKDHKKWLKLNGIDLVR